MHVSRKITAIIIIAIIAVCMSGYFSLIPVAIERITWLIANRSFIMNVYASELDEPMEETAPSTGGSVIDLTKAFITRIENRANNIAFLTQFVEFNGFLNLTMDKNSVPDIGIDNTIYKTLDGHLVGLSSRNSISAESVINVAELNNNMLARGIDFLYICAPGKIGKYEDRLPKGLTDYSNDNKDAFLSALASYSVPYVDLREEMYEQGINHQNMFYKTDHHWTTEAGLWTTGLLFDEYIQEYRHGGVDMYDPANYNRTVYEDIFLGSQGRRTGRSYAGTDSYTLYTPKFETWLSLDVPSKDIYLEGSFSDALVDQSMLVKDYYNIDTHSTYLGGGGHILKIIRNVNGNGKKCMLIRTSFAGDVSPFLSLSFSELHNFDIRGIEDYSVYEYIDEIEPDIVMILYNGVPIENDDIDVTFRFDKTFLE